MCCNVADPFMHSMIKAFFGVRSGLGGHKGSHAEDVYVLSCLQESQEFKMVCDAQSAAALRDALERRGAREGQLSATLDRRLEAILQCMPADPLRCGRCHATVPDEAVEM